MVDRPVRMDGWMVDSKYDEQHGRRSADGDGGAQRRRQLTATDGGARRTATARRLTAGRRRLDSAGQLDDDGLTMMGQGQA